MPTGTRIFEIRASDADGAKRTAPVTLSTNSPIATRGGFEVLDHSPGAIDLSRTPLPLLTSHNGRALPIGVIENLATDGTRLRGQVRLGKSKRASEAWQDIQDGILRSVSVGYDIGTTRRESDTTHITRWTPLEGSLVSMPADINAGLYRNIHTEDSAMNEIQEIENKNAKRIAAIDATRDRLIKMGVGDANARADRAIADGTSCADFSQQAFASLESKGAITRGYVPVELDRPYSLANAILSQIPKSQLGGMQVDAGFEIEASQEIAHRSHRDPRGIFMPLGNMQRRDITQGGSGGNLVATNLLAQDFIELLRNRARVLQLGATVLDGLVGNVAIPAQTGAATAAWVAEDGALTESDPTFSQLSLSPHMLTAFTKVSRRMMLQSTPAVQQVVERDFALQLAIGIDAAAIAGTGASNQPTGILSTSGIGSVALGTNGAAPTYASIVGLYEAVANANADRGALGFLTNAKVKSTLLQTAKIGSTFPEFVWESPSENDQRALDGVMIGYRAAVSNNVPSNLTKGTGSSLSAIIFGNWNDLVVANWSGLDVLVDPYTYASTGEIAIYAFQAVDIGVRHAASFAAIVDAIAS